MSGVSTNGRSKPFGSEVLAILRVMRLCPERAESLLPTLSATRQRFDLLQRRLVGALARENIGSLGDELGAAAQ
ncbi:MAG: hypothetical protein ACKPAH_10385, partial [Verrucomicrobiota bacterium]